MKMTSALANKYLKMLNEEKEFGLSREKSNSTYVAAIDEEPVIPEYDFVATESDLNVLDMKIMTIKHALNVSNCTAKINVQGETYSVDELLVRMSQLNKRKATLDTMRKRSPKSRVESNMFRRGSNAIEYEYANYDLAEVEKEFDLVSQRIYNMQLALDLHNQTVDFEVDVTM